MKPETAVLLSIGILTATTAAYAYAKKKPHIASSLMGTLGAMGLIYTFIREAQV